MQAPRVVQDHQLHFRDLPNLIINPHQYIDLATLPPHVRQDQLVLDLMKGSPKVHATLIFTGNSEKLTTVISFPCRTEEHVQNLARFCRVPVGAETDPCYRTCTRGTTKAFDRAAKWQIYCRQEPEVKEPQADTAVLRASLGKRFVRPDAWKQAGRKNPGRALREWLASTDQKLFKQIRDVCG